MACAGSSEKDISVGLEKLSITSADQTSSQTKNNSENPPPLQSQILSAMHKIRKSKNSADVKARILSSRTFLVKAIAKKINETSGISFDEGCIAVNMFQLLDKKIITNVKTPQHLDSFDVRNCIRRTEQCQKYIHVIRNLLDDIINNALDNLEKSSDATKITTSHTNEMSAIVQQFTSDDTLIPIPNDIHTPIKENHRTSISVPSIDESFQKLELKI